MKKSDKLINNLNLIPHPEGGHFSEIYRDTKGCLSHIYYLLQSGEKSHWHKLTKNENLHFYDGDPMLVQISYDSKNIISKKLGRNLHKEECLHLVIKANSWFSMKSLGKYSLIGCTVAPAFDYADFDLAPQNWEPGKN